MKYILALLVACTPTAAVQTQAIDAPSRYEAPPEQTYTYTLEQPKTHHVVEATPTPVDCQDQAVLAAYGARKATPLCIEGTEAEVEHDGCYWSLARGAAGDIRPPTHECHNGRNPCFARIVKQVRVDGVVVEHREACR